MEESEENMSSEDVRKVDSPSAVKKPKKRSMVERELETNLTARITSPAAIGEGLSTSRYGRARRLKTEAELIESQKALLASIKSPGNESTPVKVTSPVYRMHASNSPHKSETPKKSPATYLENQIDNIYQENISLSRFSEEQVSSPAKKFPKVYIRKDLIQKREEDDNIMLIKNLFSPSKSGSKPSSNLSDNSVHSIEKYNAKPNGLIDNSSVVKTLDFDSNKKKKKEDREQKVGLSKNELFEMEAKCPYQVGDLAWARVGSFPFWPCLVTRDPYSDMFVKKKLFGRVEHDLVHVTFFGDNGRRSWIVDNMLRAYLGLREFLDTRDAFTSEDKKKDPKLYAAFFVSEKKQALWNLSVDEAETLLREPKRLRIDIFNEMLWKSRASKKPPKSGKISSRTNSDVSLSESLYDSLFSEKEAKADDVESSKKTRNKSFDVSEVVTACLDNMAAKTGITKIQRQSHMDRWLQKAKSKTPEKTQAIQALTNTNTKPEQSDKAQVKSLVPVKSSGPVKLIRKSGSKTSTKPSVPASHAKPYRFRNRTVSKPKLTQMEDIEIKNESNIEDNSGIINDSNTKSEEISSTDSDANAIVNVEKENDGSQAISEVAVIVEDDSNSTQSKKESVVQNTDESVNDSAIDAVVIKEPESINDIVAKIEISVDKDLHEPTDNAIIESSADETNNSLLSTNIAKVSESLENVTQDISTTDDKIVTSGEYNLESNKESVQDTQLSKTVEDVEQITSTSIVVATPHLDNVCPMENSQENSNIMSTPNVSQNSLMEIDQSMDDVETVQDSSEKTNTCEVLNNLMEVDESTNLKTQANEDASINSETVSNKSVEDDVSTDLKEAQNVTIEVSVTEKKKDDTINKLQQEREQESIDEPNPSQITETEVDTLIFLDESNFTTKFAETDLIPPGNSSTHEKYEERKLSGQKTDVVPTTLSHTEMNKNKVIEVKDDTSENSMINVHTETNSESTEDVINNDDKTMQFSNDVFNESTNSVSILCADDSHRITEETILDTSLNDSVRSECALENSEFQINECGNDITTMTGTTENVHTLGNGTECLTEEIQNGSTRQYVESPTFTQLLDSEEFFRDVNETPNGPTKLGSQERGQCPEITANDDEKNTNNVEKVFQDFEDDDEVTSDDEPSPEYESLDDEITEDFRKHMMSIENNIKDKKDEDQIVKICNEIAEKAKQSPTKYTQDLEIARPIDKLDTYSRSVTNSEKKGDIKVEKSTKKGTHKKVQDATVRRDENPMKQNKQCITLLDRNDINELNAPYTDFTKKLNRSDTHLRKYTHTNVAPEKCADSKIPSKEHDSKMNGDATVHEILDKPKIIYRTRSSVSSSKDRASPDVRIESLKIEQYRKSCEYEPKVVIVRLERDKMDQSIKASKAKPVDEDNFEDNNKSQVCTSGSFEDNVINAKIIETVEEKSENKSIGNEEKIINKKTRLSLKRDSPKRNRIATKEIQRRSVIPEIKSVNLTPEALKEDEIMIATNVPKKIEITNDECETSLPEPVKVNGYHHIIDRKFTDTPDSYGDTDFDVDAVSLNSEDSEVSLPNSVESIPKRSLRSRPERTLESALRNPEFLKFLELRQDYVMDMHPDLTEDEVLSYVHKTWQYEEDLKSDTKKTDDTRIKQETPRSKKSKKSQPKNCIENFFREKYENSKNTTDIVPETDITANSNEVVELKVELKEVESAIKTEVPPKRKKRSTTPIIIDLATDASGETLLVKDNVKNEETTLSETDEGSLTPRRSSRSRLIPKSLDKEIFVVEDTPDETKTKEREVDTESIGSEDSEIPLRQLRSKVLKEKEFKKEPDPEKKVDAVPANKEPTLENNINTVSGIKEPVVNSVIKDEVDETASTVSDNEPLVKQKKKKPDKDSLNDPAFIQYLELRQDAIMDENPQLSQDEIVQYLHKIWVYEESSKTALEKNDELEQEANLVKGLNNNEVAPVKRPRGRPKIEKHTDDSEAAPKEKPRRRIAQPFYNENYSDIEDELEVFEIFKTKKSAITVVSKAETEKDKSSTTKPVKESPKALQSAKKESELISDDDVQFIDETELYFKDLTKPKPNIFKGIIREKVCDICECVGSLVKCKGCHGMFHPDCVKKQAEPVEKPKESDVPLKGRKKKRKPFRKLKGPEDSESHSDDKSYDVSADTSIEDIGLAEICTIDAEYFESQVEIKMKEMLTAVDINYDSYSSDEGIDWGDAVAGTCEIVDVKLKRRDLPIDYSDFKCHNCQQHSIPVCFVCKSAISKTEVKMRQKCHVAHCNKYYHLECLDHWPQTQFNSGEPSRSNKKKNEFLESLTCPRHVCHTCVSDDPRGCKTRFSGDKLAKCVRCPATYHAFNKCLPAGSRVLTASHIVCPRHSEQRAGKVPCHVNTGWCFICALGGSLICCEYCPTSFHAECLNISPPEGNYMCEDCETGRLPLYGEMVWVKLGQYRWWPGMILHPSEIPENIMLVKHELGDFVVRFFGQYDHYWVNRGRVFPYQEGDSGRISSQKSKINADFILAIEHAQRAYTILKNAAPDEEESLDIASSLLPPHYVKLRSNKPSGALCGRRAEDPSLSLTQCECNPDEPEPCGPYSQCLNRMLLTECGPTCRAGERCYNRAFERRLYPRLTPYRTPQRGWGLKTLEPIKAGQFVIEYVGELIDEEEFRRRMRRKHEVRDENFYFLTLDKERMIDAGPKGNVARFMNHCCEPNCETQKWTVLGDVRVGLFALRDIPANSEVTFNYNLECAGIEKKRCLCGAARCSGYIGAKPKQDESQSKKGKEGKLKRQYNKKKKSEESPSTAKIKKKLGRPPKPRELTDLEKDVLIIKNAAHLSDEPEENKTTDIHTEEKNATTKRKSNSNPTEQVSLCNGHEEKPKSLKRKRRTDSISTEEVSISNGQEPSVKKLKCDKPSEVGD